jgi:hypothetical protein
MTEVSDSYECDRGGEACEDRDDEWKAGEAVQHESQNRGGKVDEALPEVGGWGSMVFCVMHCEPPNVVRGQLGDLRLRSRRLRSVMCVAG